MGKRNEEQRLQQRGFYLDLSYLAHYSRRFFFLRKKVWRNIIMSRGEIEWCARTEVFKLKDKY